MLWYGGCMSLIPQFGSTCTTTGHWGSNPERSTISPCSPSLCLHTNAAARFVWPGSLSLRRDGGIMRRFSLSSFCMERVWWRKKDSIYNVGTQFLSIYTCLTFNFHFDKSPHGYRKKLAFWVNEASQVFYILVNFIYNLYSNTTCALISVSSLRGRCRLDQLKTSGSWLGKDGLG